MLGNHNRGEFIIKNILGFLMIFLYGCSNSPGNILVQRNEYKIIYIPLAVEYYEPLTTDEELEKYAFFKFSMHSVNIDKLFERITINKEIGHDTGDLRVKITNSKTKDVIYIESNLDCFYLWKRYFFIKDINIVENVVDDIVEKSKAEMCLNASYIRQRKNIEKELNIKKKK